MTAALIILVALVAVGVALYAHDRWLRARQAPADAPAEPQEEEQAEGEGCCGMHITCEKDSLLAAVSQEVVYYDDEELDAYKGRAADDYADDETEQFRDVLLTLLPDDIAGWARSLQLRGIELPAPVKDELIMIVAEERQKRAARPTTL